MVKSSAIMLAGSDVFTVVLRLATPTDAELLDAWSKESHVIAATTDDPDADTAFQGAVWADELASQSDVNRYFVAEFAGRAIGALQISDPQLEPTHYWGEIEAGLRAIDIWIGRPDALGKGYGEQMMRWAFRECFNDPAVAAIVIDPLASNIRAIRFYERLGFKATERRFFGDDECLVHRLTRQDWLLRFAAD
jgi:aminoglycoside 6'-N-acetyltransferase